MKGEELMEMFDDLFDIALEQVLSLIKINECGKFVNLLIFSVNHCIFLLFFCSAK